MIQLIRLDAIKRTAPFKSPKKQNSYMLVNFKDHTRSVVFDEVTAIIKNWYDYPLMYDDSGFLEKLNSKDEKIKVDYSVIAQHPSFLEQLEESQPELFI